ncbi:hypothetical protein HDV63DRAFT_391152 [Trichoderma sp. SZMC 28014]
MSCLLLSLLLLLLPVRRADKSHRGPQKKEGVEPSSWMLDVGANGRARLRCFRPSQALLRLLRLRLASLGCELVLPRCYCCSSTWL